MPAAHHYKPAAAALAPALWPAPWHLSHATCRRILELMQWQTELGVDLIGRAAALIREAAPSATLLARDLDRRELWTSAAYPALQWVVARRPDQMPVRPPAHVVWVGYTPPPRDYWRP